MKLFGTEYKITFCKRQKDVHEAAGNPYGSVDHHTKHIRIYKKPGMKPAVNRQSYVHEVLHIISWESGLGLKEKTVEILALGLCSWMNENGIKVPIK